LVRVIMEQLPPLPCETPKNVFCCLYLDFHTLVTKSNLDVWIEMSYFLKKKIQLS
jgi:hypothetical protein